MKHKILSVAIAIVALSGITVMAQNDKDANATENEQCCQCPKCKENKPCGPFAGIELTAEQQEALKAIQPKRPECGPRMEPGQGGPECGPRKEPGQGGPECGPRMEPGQRPECCDSAATRPDPRQERRDYLTQVKGILTAEQYVTFLENIALENGAQPRQMMRPNGDMRPRMHKAASDSLNQCPRGNACPQGAKHKNKK